MKCPHCSFENAPDAKFCIHCGSALPQQPSRARRAVTAILKALCYYFLFLGVQSAVIFLYECVLIFRESMGMAMSGSALEFEAIYSELMQNVLTQLYANIHTLMILSAALTFLCLFLLFQLRHKNPLAEMSVRPAPVSKMAIALVLGVAVQFFVAITLSLIPLPQSLVESFNENSALLYGGGPLWLEIVSVAVVTPILEETIFRGLVFTRLRRGMSTSLAVGVAAVIFGAAHGHIISFVYAGCLGILLSLLMLRCGDSILVPICCHAGFNAGSYLLSMALGETDSLPLIMAYYFASIALTVLCTYAIFRRDTVSEE